MSNYSRPPKTNARFLGRSLSGDVIICQAVVVVLATMILVSFGYMMLSKRIDRSYTLKAKEYIAFLQQSLAVPVWGYDEESISYISKSFIQNELIAGIEVLSNNGEVLFR